MGKKWLTLKSTILTNLSSKPLHFLTILVPFERVQLVAEQFGSGLTVRVKTGYPKNGSDKKSSISSKR